MGQVTIEADNEDILNELVSTSNAKALEAATETGPFLHFRDAYVFAASIGMALNCATPAEKMSTSRKNRKEIPDHVFFGAPGAKELALVVGFVLGGIETETSTKDAMTTQLQLLSDQDDCLNCRLAMLDRFADGGFAWLREHREDESDIRALVLTAINEIDAVKRPRKQVAPDDPLLNMLGMELS